FGRRFAGQWVQGHRGLPIHLSLSGVSAPAAAAYHTHKPSRSVAMLRLIVCPAAVLVCGIVAIGAAMGQAPESADFVLQGGKVYTLDAKDTVASAVAVHGERIVFIGSDAEAAKYIGPKTEISQAAGRTVHPGLNETQVQP